MIINKDDDLYIIRIFKEVIKDVDIYDIDFISTFFKDILIKLRNKYNIKGFCNIEVFVNNYYGMIIEIFNSCKYGKDIDIKINLHIDSLFMHEINYCDINYYYDCYLYKDKYYSTYRNISDSEIIYKDTDKIIKKGIKIK